MTTDEAKQFIRERLEKMVGKPAGHVKHECRNIIRELIEKHRFFMGDAYMPGCVVTDVSIQVNGDSMSIFPVYQMVR